MFSFLPQTGTTTHCIKYGVITASFNTAGMKKQGYPPTNAGSFKKLPASSPLNALRFINFAPVQ
ncbi:hypothetical protein SAMN05192529_11710 [Arachidicoccus rhizosphaerae]|jgi:hypothetical protein|uniref:Uncharacterized protein n=1 Tax=Arachidicoccus rhizosphaerae TaxID=551991 RepID=A0A1H4AXC5_9BACT|nr:hypothetical protein SAMN05192529_11710 [Arachidicoccus rhizosphaerae]